VGGKQAGFACARQGKAECRHGQDGDILEVEGRAGRTANLFFFVNAQACRAQDPIGHPAGAWLAPARGVTRVADDGALFVDKLDALCLAMRAVAQELVAGLVEVALKCIDLELELAALIAVAGAVDAHIAPGLGQVLGHVVFQPVRPNGQIATAQARGPVNHGALIRLPCQFVTRQKNRRARANLCRNGFLQHAAGLEPER
jgi:hypothetical protein